MTDELLAGQTTYYRRRAAEYDVTAYGDVPAARERIAGIVAALAPSGDVLEIACGTGLWTEALARHAKSLVALDAAPETIAIARRRVGGAGVRFEIADVFAWTSSRRFDVIFFAAWLSHVPDRRFDEFWQRLRSLLADGGRVVFFDEPLSEQAKESYVNGEKEVVERRLEDGTTFRIVKNFVDPDALVARLGSLGWDCRIQPEGTDWLRGEARPSEA